MGYLNQDPGMQINQPLQNQMQFQGQGGYPLMQQAAPGQPQSNVLSGLSQNQMNQGAPVQPM